MLYLADLAVEGSSCGAAFMKFQAEGFREELTGLTLEIIRNSSQIFTFGQLSDEQKN